MKKALVLIISAIMIGAVAVGCTNSNVNEGESTLASQVEASESTQSIVTESTLNNEGDYEVSRSKALELAEAGFEDFDLAVIGNPDKDESFEEAVITLQTLPSGDEDADESNQWADLYGKDVWYVQYKLKDNAMNFVYFVIDTDTVRVLDSGYMGD